MSTIAGSSRSGAPAKKERIQEVHTAFFLYFLLLVPSLLLAVVYLFSSPCLFVTQIRGTRYAYLVRYIGKYCYLE